MKINQKFSSKNEALSKKWRKHFQQKKGRKITHKVSIHSDRAWNKKYKCMITATQDACLLPEHPISKSHFTCDARHDKPLVLHYQKYCVFLIHTTSDKLWRFLRHNYRPINFYRDPLLELSGLELSHNVAIGMKFVKALT